MKTLATFDRTEFSESILPLLGKIAGIPDAEFTLLCIAPPPSDRERGGRRTLLAVGGGWGASVPVVVAPDEPRFVETKLQAIERTLMEAHEYLRGLTRKLPEGTPVHAKAHISDRAAETIIACARAEAPDVIVMATHSRRAVSNAMFGSTTRRVVRSGVAPVLVVHPTSSP